MQLNHLKRGFVGVFQQYIFAVGELKEDRVVKFLIRLLFMENDKINIYIRLIYTYILLLLLNINYYYF